MQPGQIKLMIHSLVIHLEQLVILIFMCLTLAFLNISATFTGTNHILTDRLFRQITHTLPLIQENNLIIFSKLTNNTHLVMVNLNHEDSHWSVIEHRTRKQDIEVGNYRT